MMEVWLLYKQPDDLRRRRKFPLAGIKKDQLDTALGYFENNAPRMRYHWFRQCGLFAGSGVVEASCKSVIGQRLKLSGMHWSLHGAAAITTLRCQQASRPEDQVCSAPHNQTAAARKMILGATSLSRTPGPHPSRGRSWC